jgi:photosystem II stability/assembly factor-like uncharacterized protein
MTLPEICTTRLSILIFLLASLVCATPTSSNSIALAHYHEFLRVTDSADRTESSGGVQGPTSLRLIKIRNEEDVPSQAIVDLGRMITFKTIDLMGDRCAIVYGGPPLGVDDFLIQDCGGSTWTKRWSYDNGYIKRMAFPNEQVGWFVIGHGLVKVQKVDDTLQATVIRNEPARENIESVFFVNEQFGWICGDEGMIFKTDDAGVTWKPQRSNTDLRLKEIRFTNPLEGWVSGGEYRNNKYEGVLLTTRDGGATWAPAEEKKAGNLSPVFFTSAYHGCGIDDDNSIRCTNDGETWRVAYKDRGSRKRKVSIFFASEKQGWVVGDGIWHTSNGGTTWHEQLLLPVTSHELKNVLFLDNQLGWAQSLEAVWRTADGGRTWTKVSDVWMRRLKAEPSNVSAGSPKLDFPKLEVQSAKAPIRH